MAPLAYDGRLTFFLSFGPPAFWLCKLNRLVCRHVQAHEFGMGISF
jgi:hypothetical protein